MSKLAPIAIFVYNRINELQQTVETLKENYLAKDSELFIFSDGSRDEKGKEKVDSVRKYLRTINGFKKIVISEAESNMGLANSIISGVTQMLENYDKIIVLEDDLVSSRNFLDFMNQALDFYEDSKDVLSISGYTHDLPSLKKYERDYYVGYRASSLGWGTWKNKWIGIDWKISDYKEFKNSRSQRRKLGRIGSDMPRMLRNQQAGKIDSWAIRWCYHQFKYDLKCVFASKSKVNHIGVDDNATNAADALRFLTPLDPGAKRSFSFDMKLEDNNELLKEFRAKNSITARVKLKFRKIVKKLFR